jgi:NADH-quinone oxidoreductase subunit J
MIALTLLIVPLCIIYSWKHFPEPKNPKAFLILILILETGMLGSFVAQDLILFFVIASVVALSASAVAFTTDIVRSAVWLLFTLVGVSMLYFLLGAEFVGATQLIVYVGGTMVLVVFGVMLTAQKQFLKMRIKEPQQAIAMLLAVLLFLALCYVTSDLRFAHLAPATETLPSAGPIGMGFLSKYLLPFEIVSVHLLVVLIGAAYLARAKRRPNEEGPP